MTCFKQELQSAGKRQAVEQAWPHPSPGRVLGNTTSTYELRAFFSPVTGTHVHATGTPRLLRGEGTSKVTTGGRQGIGEATSFSTPLRFASCNCCRLSKVTMSQCKDLGFNILAFAETHDGARTQARSTRTPPPNEKYFGCFIVISPSAKRAASHTGSIASRIVFARIRGPPFNLFVICVYLPH